MIEGAVLFCEGSPEAIAEAFRSVAQDLGYAPATGAPDLDVHVAASEHGVCFSFELPKTFALALGRRLAARVRLPVRVLTARLVEGKGDAFECDVSDHTVARDGSLKPGRWADDMIVECADDWGAICDGKAYFAVGVVMDGARDTVLPQREPKPLIALRAPPSVGSPRLDEIALQARLADRAELATMAGRTCIRTTSAGATTTSFVEPHEAEALRAALGALLGPT